MKRGLLIITFVSIIILGALHQVGSAFYLYWDVSWFDVLMHFIGGFSISLLFLWFWYRSKGLESRRAAILEALVFVSAVGISWEVFEYAFDIANPVGMSYLSDTLKDFALDLIGGLTGAAVGTLKVFHE